MGIRRETRPRGRPWRNRERRFEVKQCRRASSYRAPEMGSCPGRWPAAAMIFHSLRIPTRDIRTEAGRLCVDQETRCRLEIDTLAGLAITSIFDMRLDGE